jgi:hypothetical protein
MWQEAGGTRRSEVMVSVAGRGSGELEPSRSGMTAAANGRMIRACGTSPDGPSAAPFRSVPSGPAEVRRQGESERINGHLTEQALEPNRLALLRLAHELQKWVDALCGGGREARGNDSEK